MYSLQARRLPVEVLTTVVRAVFEPNEYPASIQRLYAWTPDEAIPEIYNDPTVFSSIHPAMADLAVPEWSSGPEDFVERHRWDTHSEYANPCMCSISATHSTAFSDTCCLR